MNAAEADICKLKRASSMKIIPSHIPKKLWYYYLEFEAYVCSYTVNDIYLCDNEFPEL